MKIILIVLSLLFVAATGWHSGESNHDHWRPIASCCAISIWLPGFAGYWEVGFLHDCGYSVRRLFTGLAIAALID